MPIDATSALAVAGFAAIHSALASLAAKRWFAAAFGERARDAWYRPLFIIQAAGLTAALAWVVLGRPSPVLWSVDGAGAWLMRAAQALLLIAGIDSARRVGVPAMLGWPGLRAWLAGAPRCPREPEAQGPHCAPEASARGLFRWSRHPLNLLPVPLLWLEPHMTAAMASAFAVASAYFVVGSWHEEVRLLRVHGDAYQRYRRSGVPFFIPWRRGRPPEADDRTDEGG